MERFIAVALWLLLFMLPKVDYDSHILSFLVSRFGMVETVVIAAVH